MINAKSVCQKWIAAEKYELRKNLEAKIKLFGLLCTLIVINVYLCKRFDCFFCLFDRHERRKKEEMHRMLSKTTKTWNWFFGFVVIRSIAFGGISKDSVRLHEKCEMWRASKAPTSKTDD